MTILIKFHPCFSTNIAYIWSYYILFLSAVRDLITSSDNTLDFYSEILLLVTTNLPLITAKAAFVLKYCSIS